jgi:hypothetical protein
MIAKFQGRIMLHRSPKVRFSPSSSLKRGRHWLWITALIIVFFVGYTVGSNIHPASLRPPVTPTPTTTQPVATPTPSEPAIHYKVGQRLQINGIWQVTVTTAHTSSGDQNAKPKPGNTFLLIDIEMKNISSQPQTVSSLSQYTLHDTVGQAYPPTPLSSAPTPDGTLQAGAQLKGTLTYEVPATIHAYILGFLPVEDGQPVLWDIQD